MNEFQLLPNPTNIPEAVSTGYQRQNTNIFCLQTGLDTTNPTIVNNGNTIFISAGCIVEDNGSLFKLPNDASISIPNINTDYFIFIHDNGDGTADLRRTDIYPTFIPSKNGWYTSNNERVLNHFYMRKILVEKDINNENIGAVNFIDLEARPIVRTDLTNLSVGGGAKAATLGDGSVLFGGISNLSDASAIVNKYDINGVRTTLENLSAARPDLAVASLGDGSVLFGGGGATISSIPDYAIVDKYDINGVKTTITSLSVARTALTAASLGDGSVLFGGGYSGNLISGETVYAIVDKYDINGVRTTLENLSAARDSIAAATLGDGSVLFGGGWNILVDLYATVDKYDINGVRTTLENLSAAKFNLGASTLGDGSVLFGGGTNGSSTFDTVDKYDINGVRTTLTNLSVARSGLGAATLGDGSVLFGGGSISNASTSDTVDKYDINGVKTTLTNLSVARRGLGAATLGDGSVLFGGGIGNNTASISIVEKYSNTLNLNLPYGSKYRFNDDTTEKTTKDIVIKSTPNKGYIRYNSNSTI